jgi:uncharacterized protein
MIHIKSKSGNNYIYNFTKNSITLTHPFVCKNLDQNEKGFKDPLFTNREMEIYYSTKKEFLLSNEILSPNDTPVKFRHFKEKAIESSFSNISHIVLEITERCNLKCAYCTFGDMYNNYDPRYNNEMSLDKAIALINHLKYYWDKRTDFGRVKEVQIAFIGGEPLMNFDFIRKFIDYVNNLKISQIKFKFKIITNGLLVKKYINYIVENNVELQISLDGDKNDNCYRV